jgi:NO-binding membrane sensor protein with MHYT domain
MTGNYSPSLVVVSLLVAVLASYTALDMAGRLATAKGAAARWWLAGGATAMGLGIWSMHFIGMLAFDLPIPLGYDPKITLYSLAVSIGASTFALWRVSRPRLTWQQLLTGAVLMGLGIAAMHYVGMAACSRQSNTIWAGSPRQSQSQSALQAWHCGLPFTLEENGSTRSACDHWHPSQWG